MNSQTPYELADPNYQTTKADVIADLLEIVYLLKKPKSQLRQKNLFAKETAKSLKSLVREVQTLLGHVQKNPDPKTIDFKKVFTQRTQFQQEARSLIKKAAVIAWNDEWQSPSFTKQTPSMTGRYTGVIDHTINDYKRDQHALARNYEADFIRSYYPTSILHSFSALTTNSGMGAFSLITSFLQSEGVEHFAVGSHSYFEIKLLIKTLYKKSTSFDEGNLKTLDAFCALEGKKAIFFDTISNDQDVFHVNREALLRYLQTNARDAYVVIDNTVSSVMVQIQTLQRKYRHLKIIGFESLNKFHQFGLDMVTGGIVYAKRSLTAKMRPLRMHLGLISNDFSILVLPTPNRKLFQARLNRLHRNTALIQNALNGVTKGKSESPAPFFAFSFPPKKATISQYKLFCRKIYKKARKQKIVIAGGTSFGLNHSRLYLTALHSRTSKPFVRFSPGTETVMEIASIIRLLQKSYT